MRSRHSLTRRSVLTATAGLVAAGALPAPAHAERLSPGRPKDWRPVARDVRREMLHTWNSYKRLAWGHDHLLPVSGGHSEFFDQEHPVGLTIVEALDTLYLMELDDELAEGVAWVKENLDFSAVNADVQVFETNIRMVGGLLSGYLATGERALLRHAKQIADILMPCFDRSPTGIPYRFVNPSTGEISGVTNPLAEVGTIITEFGTLSRLTGDRRYHRAARKAMKAVIERRSDLDLLGTEINVETGEWVNDTATVHPPVDSFYEYVWDAWDLFGDTEFRDLYRMLTRAIIKHEATTINGHVWFAQVDKDDAEQVTAEQSELGSFYAGLLGQSGHRRLGDAYLASWTSVLDRFPVLPEGYDPTSGAATAKGNQLRPEYVDSCFNLWLVEGPGRHASERYRKLAYDYYLRQKKHSRVPNGWTIIDDVTTSPLKHGDLTSGYWWSEQMKYWYLMFAKAPRFDYRNNYLSTEGNAFRGLRRR
ncbi:mannosyl-oligosaccharide alpha-1,2-mannosidase [Actinomadura madurae]|uniref:Mannosyl-oligosaccharide alpha-1,2-mannosidase n=1 Tax=Actinomadura madurae TaxID=1993 RepID=A0A1I4XXI2_9ACTN|nr:glycoside hydrolase family 47 protein [Actinomadura madurae]SFN30608.1 mannosyl-oligosaccharide alpha-1,2-mannosidase [Actinomadura madurae]